MMRRFSIALAGALAGCVSTSDNAPSSATIQPSPIPSTQHAAVTTTVAYTGNGLHEKIVTYDPPKYIASGQWLTKEIYFSEVPGEPNVVFHVPCIRMNRVDPPHVSTEQCTGAKIEKGELAGKIITADGEIITPPPF